MEKIYKGIFLMNNIKKLLSIMPPIKRVNLNKVSNPLIYIGAVGFEDRALSILKKAIQLGKK